MSLRRDWKFEFTTDVLLPATAAKLAHHRERHEWWQGELFKAETELKEKGLSVRAHRVSGGEQRHEAVIDHTYQRRVQECSEHLHKHAQSVEGYERWERAFKLNPGKSLELDEKDIAFFGL